MALNWNEEQTRRRMLAVPVAYFFFYLLYFTLLQEYARPKFWSGLYIYNLRMRCV